MASSSLASDVPALDDCILIKPGDIKREKVEDDEVTDPVSEMEDTRANVELLQIKQELCSRREDETIADEDDGSRATELLLIDVDARQPQRSKVNSRKKKQVPKVTNPDDSPDDAESDSSQPSKANPTDRSGDENQQKPEVAVGAKTRSKSNEERSKKTAVVVKAEPQSPKRRKRVAAEVTPTKKLAPRKAALVAKSNLGDKSIKDSSPVALLDMLAEVASATLENDPTIRSKQAVVRRSPLKRKKVLMRLRSSGPVKAASMKRIPQQDLLNLDEIRTLSDKLLLNLFSEMTSDEIRRNYTYTCYLVPDKCEQMYTSFGNEAKARMQMKTHLLGHIAELLAEATAPGKTQKTKFVAESIMARKRRLATEQEEEAKRRFLRKTPVVKAEPRVPLTRVKTPVGKAKKVTLAISTPSKAGAIAQQPAPVSADSTKSKKLPKIVAGKQSPAKPDAVKSSGSASEDVAKEATPEVEVAGDVAEDFSAAQAAQEAAKQQQQLIAIKTILVPDVTRLQIGGIDDYDNNVLLYQQPHHDHCYTVMEGTRRPQEFVRLDEGMEDDDDDGGYVIGKNDSIGFTKAVQIVEINSTETVVEQEPSVAGGKRKLQPAAEIDLPESEEMQRKKTASGGQIAVKCGDGDLNKILEEEMLISFDDEDDGKDEQAGEVTDPDQISDWERRVALKCIRLLRTKKKDERVPLVCTICKDKTFTAQATLMYHYRSHAGIKPFVCNICNTTFTRQHSLNYHMLIHNNKSRFTCGDCGRKFRHPSHFKEHMRRHTGETPFECSDCGVRFKTRNTYKRHLKTRHGKLLTVNGIFAMSHEDFLKVKTNPKKRQRPRRDKETQWPELLNLEAITAAAAVAEHEELESEDESMDPGADTLAPLLAAAGMEQQAAFDMANTTTTFILTADPNDNRSGVQVGHIEGEVSAGNNSIIKVFPIGALNPGSDAIPIVIQGDDLTGGQFAQLHAVNVTVIEGTIDGTPIIEGSVIGEASAVDEESRENSEFIDDNATEDSVKSILGL